MWAIKEQALLQINGLYAFFPAQWVMSKPRPIQA
jgi:hypothetical protein